MGRKKKKKRSNAGRPIKDRKSPEEIAKAIADLATDLDLDIVDKEILRLKSLDPFLDVRTISKKLGVHHATIAYRLKKPKFRRMWDQIMETTAEAMERNARRAAQRLYDLINHKNERIALDAIKLALAPYINQFTHQVAVAPVVTYKTTVQADSSLLQQVIEGDVLDITENAKAREVVVQTSEVDSVVEKLE